MPTTTYNIENWNRTQNKNGGNLRIGGGIAIGISTNLNYERIDQIFLDINNDIEIIAIRIIHEQMEYICINIYLPNY